MSKTLTKIRVRCHICKVEAEIDKGKKEIVLYLPPLKLPKQFRRCSPPISMCFPSHFDCELAKPVDQIDLNKLVKVEAAEK